ncbi:MAG TPA: hypothetical protein DCE56_00875 [Cyanobacteria bacterium UBA8553]|nr:hypothetical protein [Cyanobacteria bacterium UBA8553]HAJ59572.1 hypothetical protein [Cyanobacteria bacterium UBA8543]
MLQLRTYANFLFLISSCGAQPSGSFQSDEDNTNTGIGRTLNSIGGVYYQLGEYTQALRFFEQVLAVRTQVGDRSGIATTLNNMGLIYDKQGTISLIQ